LISPFIDTETEILIGDFLKKIVFEVKSSSPQLLSEFSVITSAHLDTVFAKCRKNFVSLLGITNKEILLATILASLLEKYGTPAVVETIQRYFKSEYSGFTPPVAQLKSLLARAPKEDLNRLEACIPLFTLPERKDKLQVSTCLAKVDLNRPVYMRRLNRLIRIAGTLEIRTASKKIQEILEFARDERIHFLEETAIVTLCQLLTRSIIEQSKEYFGQPDKNIRTLNGYLRGSRFIPAKIMIGPLVHLLLLPSLTPSSRDLILDSLLCMDLSGVKRILPALLKCLDMEQISEEQKLRVGEILCRDGDSSIGHQLLDMTGHSDPIARRVAVRVLLGLARRGEGVAAEVLTNRLYVLLEDKEGSVMVDAVLALLALNDDYAVQIVADYIESGDDKIVAEILANLGKSLSRETFALVMDTMTMESPAVQKALRTLLPDLCQGVFAEELRQVLLESITVIPEKSGLAILPAAPHAPQPQADSLLGQAKLEFVFKRENTQELTVFFIDIAGYTEKSTTIDMSSLLNLIKTFEDTVSSAIAVNRGSIVKKMGDGILAVFKHPLNAVIAAMAVQQKIAEHNSMRVEREKFRTRIGLNTGKVIRKDNDIFGEVVNVAARMQSAATPGDILLTQATFEDIKKFVRCTELGRIQVKGIKEAITAYSPEEVLVDLAKIGSEDAEASSRAVSDDSMEKLKESIFSPDFKIPPGAADAGNLAEFIQGFFTDISRAIEELAMDYHEEFVFKKYLQRKWNEFLAKK
jgi:class 3 adenylate cyclase